MVYDSSFVHSSPAKGMIGDGPCEGAISVHKHACRQGRNCRSMAWRVTEEVDGNHLSSLGPRW